MMFETAPKAARRAVRVRGIPPAEEPLQTVGRAADLVMEAMLLMATTGLNIGWLDGAVREKAKELHKALDVDDPPCPECGRQGFVLDKSSGTSRQVKCPTCKGLWEYRDDPRPSVRGVMMTRAEDDRRRCLLWLRNRDSQEARCLELARTLWPELRGHVHVRLATELVECLNRSRTPPHPPRQKRWMRLNDVYFSLQNNLQTEVYHLMKDLRLEAGDELTMMLSTGYTMLSDIPSMRRRDLWIMRRAALGLHDRERNRKRRVARYARGSQAEGESDEEQG